MRRIAPTLLLLALAACGPGAAPPPRQPPPPPAGFVEARDLSLDQADDPYQRVVETGLAETAAASGLPGGGDTVTYRAQVGETRAAIETYYDHAARDAGWTPDRTLAPPAGSKTAGYWSFGYRAGAHWFQVAGVTPGPALPVPEAGLPVVVRSGE